MRIDPTSKQLLTFRQLAETLPRRRGDRPTHVSTLHRWRSRGLRGVKLEAVRVGGTWATTAEAFNRFVNQLTALESGQETAVTPSASKSSKDASRRLDASGW